MTKPMIYDQKPFLCYQTKLFTHDKTLYPWSNRSPMTKYDKAFLSYYSPKAELTRKDVTHIVSNQIDSISRAVTVEGMKLGI